MLQPDVDWARSMCYIIGVAATIFIYVSITQPNPAKIWACLIVTVSTTPPQLCTTSSSYFLVAQQLYRPVFLGTRAPFYTIVQKQCCALGFTFLFPSQSTSSGRRQPSLCPWCRTGPVCLLQYFFSFFLSFFLSFLW